MQTFILHPDMEISAGRLDARRCFKQAVEIKQIYLAILGGSNGWRQHPAVLQWKNDTAELLSYGRHCLNQLTNYKANKLRAWYGVYLTTLSTMFPPQFHQLIPYHQALLLRKDYHYYKHLFTDVPSTGFARYLDPADNRIFHIKFGEKIYD